MKAMLRWVAVALMICALTLIVSSPSLAEVTPLPLDQTVPGKPTVKANWVIVKAKDALNDASVLASGTVLPKMLKYDGSKWAPIDKDAAVSKFDWISYSDPSITMRVEYATIVPKLKKKQIQSSITYITISDPTQPRTAMTNDTYKGSAKTDAAVMAKAKNAVAAVNGDFFKYHSSVGYVLRQGEFYRDLLNGKRDVLIIDNEGDFHYVLAATSDTMSAKLKELKDGGLKAINTFTLGPVLVIDGKARNMDESIMKKSGEFQWCYAQQRVAIVQVGPLEYAIVEAYGKTDGSMGMTLQEFADYIAYLFPECQLAYNLDGGGSTNVIVNGKQIEKTPGHRDITDIIYFASAYTE